MGIRNQPDQGRSPKSQRLHTVSCCPFHYHLAMDTEPARSTERSSHIVYLYVVVVDDHCNHQEAVSATQSNGFHLRSRFVVLKTEPVHFQPSSAMMAPARWQCVVNEEVNGQQSIWLSNECPISSVNALDENHQRQNSEI